MENLNNFQLENADGSEVEFIDNSIIDNHKSISVYFRNIEKHLIRHINEAEIVLGCVAWLTNENILRALSQKENVSLIVQKEDFLRPDLNIQDLSQWKLRLRELYNSLNSTLMRYNFLNILEHTSYLADPYIEPVRCVGSYNSEKKTAFPRMHNKFLIFARLNSRMDDCDIVQPYAVWTGSFNLTKNSVYSFENAVYITDIDIVNAYYNEFGQIAAMSEPLDWEREWIEPEWRIGS